MTTTHNDAKITGNILVSLFSPIEEEYIRIYGRNGVIIADKKSFICKIDNEKEIRIDNSEDEMLAMFKDFYNIIISNNDNNQKLEHEKRVKFILDVYSKFYN